MVTEERVREFGTPTLIDLFDSMPVEDFICEFELVEIGDDQAWLPWELIHATAPVGVKSIRNLDLVTLADGLKKFPDARVYAGYDVGRRHDNAELSGLITGTPASFARQGTMPDEAEPDQEEDQDIAEIADRMVAREVYARSFTRETFEGQEAGLCALLQLPRTFLEIDETGMGIQMGERLVAKFGPSRVRPVNFGGKLDLPARRQIIEAPAKMAMAVVLKDAMQSGEIEFQVDRGKAYQMHSIRRKVTEAANLILTVGKLDDDAGSREAGHHHADIFWARALATHCWKSKTSRPAFDFEVV